MTYVRSDIRTEVRDEIYESAADLITDAQLNRAISREIRSLPRNGIYLEELHTTSTVVDQLDYVLPTGTYKVELVERNWGTASQPDWQEVKGWDLYGTALYLLGRPTVVWTMRVHVRKSFTVLSDDSTSSDIPDEKVDVVILGVAVRCYRYLMGYFKNAKNWDAIAKPNGISMSQIQSWYRDIKSEYEKMIALYKTVPRPRDIDLVG